MQLGAGVRTTARPSLEQTMRRAQIIISRIRQRLADLHDRRLTPERKRQAWRDFQATGELPRDPDLLELVERLQAAEDELQDIHQSV